MSLDPVAVKVAGATIVTGGLSAGGWVVALAEQSIGTGTPLDTIVPVTALTATASAFLWLVKLMASGRLVHVDHVDLAGKLAATLERTQRLAERGHEREEQLADLVIAQGRQP